MGLIRPVVGIVGGSGKMGSWLARLLERQGLKVLCSGRKTPLRPAEMAVRCDVVVVSVPVSETLEVIQQVDPLVPDKGLLMDLTSVKKERLFHHERSMGHCGSLEQGTGHNGP